MASCSPCALIIEQEEAGLDWSMREHFLEGTVVKLESFVLKKSVSLFLCVTLKKLDKNLSV